MRSFASDNNSGVHPLVMEALNRANIDHALGYGDDKWTEEAVADKGSLYAGLRTLICVQRYRQQCRGITINDTSVSFHLLCGNRSYLCR